MFNNDVYEINNATVMMSIVGGIRWLAYKQAFKGNVDSGITDYNGGGVANYLVKVKNALAGLQ